MGFSYRRSFGLGKGARLNVSKRGVSGSKRVGRFSVNTRGGGSVRLSKGLSFRFGKR